MFFWYSIHSLEKEEKTQRMEYKLRQYTRRADAVEAESVESLQAAMRQNKVKALWADGAAPEISCGVEHSLPRESRQGCT